MRTVGMYKTKAAKKKQKGKFDILLSRMDDMCYDGWWGKESISYKNVHGSIIEAALTFKDFRVIFSIKNLYLSDELVMLITPEHYHYYRNNKFSDISDYINLDRNWNKIVKYLKNNLIEILDEREKEKKQSIKTYDEKKKIDHGKELMKQKDSWIRRWFR